MLGLDQFVRSIPLESLRNAVDETGHRVRRLGPLLQTLLDATDAFTRDAMDALPKTLALIRNGRTVLETQNEQASSIISFSEDLAVLEQFQSSRRGALAGRAARGADTGRCPRTLTRGAARPRTPRACAVRKTRRSRGAPDPAVDRGRYGGPERPPEPEIRPLTRLTSVLEA